MSINCCICKNDTTPQDLASHLLGGCVKRFNPRARANICKSRTVHLSLDVLKDGVKTESFVCLVCKDCFLCDASKDRAEEYDIFTKFHASRCGSKFEEIEDAIKPTAYELAAAKPKRPCCPKCGYDAKGHKPNLKRHMAKCKGKTEKKQPLGTKYKCQYCDYESFLSHNTKRHELTCKSKPATPANEVVFEPAKKEEAIDPVLEGQSFTNVASENEDLKAEIERLKAELEEAQLVKPAKEIKSKTAKLQILEYKNENSRLKADLEEAKKLSALLPDKTKEAMLASMNIKDDTYSDIDLIEKTIREMTKLRRRYDLLDDDYTEVNTKYEDVNDKFVAVGDALNALRSAYSDLDDLIRRSCTGEQIDALNAAMDAADG